MDKQNEASPRYAIGDVHGRPYWKSFIKDSFKEFYFTGDYFDSYTISFSAQYSNFLEICSTARKDSRIKMCLGNHDYNYLSGVNNQRYSGYQDQNKSKISAVLEENIDLIKIIYVTEDNIIISHAGLTACFLQSIGGKAPEDVNAAFNNDRNILHFNGLNIYGDDITQSPIWVRPGSLLRDPLPGYSQIAGHTPVREFSKIELSDGDTLALIDMHNTKFIYRF